MGYFFELIGQMATSVQSALTGADLSVSLLAIVMATGFVAGLTPYGVATTVLVAGQLSQVPESTRELRLRGAALFALGGAVSLLSVGAVAGLVGKVALDYSLARYLPLLTLLMGLQMVFPKLRIPRKARPAKERSAANLFLFGLPFGVIAPPCTAPIIVAVLSLVAASHELGFGLLVLLTFALGRSIPLIAACAYGDGLVRRLWFSRSSASALVKPMGLLIVAGSAYFLTAGSIYFGG